MAEALHRAGHEVQVVTSMYGLPRRTGRSPQPRRDDVRGIVTHRCLQQYVFRQRPDRRPWTFFRARDEIRDARRFRDVVERFRPDVINWWSLWGVSKLLLPLPSRWGIPD